MYKIYFSSYLKKERKTVNRYILSIRFQPIHFYFWTKQRLSYLLRSTPGNLVNMSVENMPYLYDHGIRFHFNISQIQIMITIRFAYNSMPFLIEYLFFPYSTLAVLVKDGVWIHKLALKKRSYIMFVMWIVKSSCFTWGKWPIIRLKIFLLLVELRTC